MRKLGLSSWCRLAAGILSGWLGPAAVLAGGPPELSREELIRRGRAATVVIELEPGGQHATAFCVHSSGLFVTTGHALVDPRSRAMVDRPNLIVKPGEAGREVLPGRLLQRLDDPDLAFIRVEGAKRNFDALPLGAETEIEELMDVAAFEVPSRRDQSFPSIHSAIGSVSALPRKGGKLERIQFDAPISPGGTGGPLLDTKGQVVGVVLGRARADFGAGVGLAVPVGTLREFLDRPVIAFKPPVIEREHGDEPVKFEARAFSLIPEQAPIELELVLGAKAGPQRHFAMTRSGETYKVDAVLPGEKLDQTVRIDARYPDGHIRGRVNDLTFQIGSRDVRLSDVRRLRLGPSPTAVLGNQALLAGAVSGLGTTPVALGGQALEFDLARATEITVEAPEAPVAIPCTLTASRAGNELARREASIKLGGRACFEALRAGRLDAPRRGSGPITYVSLISSPGEYAGQGRSYFFREGIAIRDTANHSYVQNGVLFRRSNAQRGVDVQVGAITSKDHWSFRFEAPLNRTLGVGDYPATRRVGFGGEQAELDFSRGHRSNSRISGHFAVWEIEFSGRDVKRLAVDFVAHTAENGAELPALYGMIRYNSTFE